MPTAEVGLGHGRRGAILDTYSHVFDELDAPRLAAVDAIVQARGGIPPQRPGVTVASA